MAYETLKDSPFVDMVSSLFRDLSDLFRKEIRLARAELTEKLMSRLQGVIWMAVAGVLGFVAFLLLLGAIVFGIASLGVPLHWSFLIVAVVVGAGAAGAFFYGRSAARESLMPEKTLRQVNEDVSAVREQMT
jgi:ABC-type multidrug transport system permease subunit